MNISDFDKYYKLFAPQSLNNERDSIMVGLVVRNHFLGNSSAKNTEMFSQVLCLQDDTNFWKTIHITNFSFWDKNY
jgi:hypothetical protein